MITAKNYIDPTTAEYHYYSKHVKVIDEITGIWTGIINRHLKTYDGFLIEVIPDNFPDSRIRVDADKVIMITSYYGLMEA